MIEEEDEKLIFKDNKKYINWTDIYKKGYNRFYTIIVIIILILNIIVFGVVYGIWLDYQYKSESTLELIYYSWNFERNTLRLVNFYNTMIFINQTMDDLTRDYFSSDEYNCIENINQILYSYYLIKKKEKKFLEFIKVMIISLTILVNHYMIILIQ